MKGKVPVRSLYKIPVHLSAKVAKQNIFASDDVLLSSILLALVVGKGWTLESKLLVNWSSQRPGLVVRYHAKREVCNKSSEEKDKSHRSNNCETSLSASSMLFMEPS
jgi:hypothetical protein